MKNIKFLVHPERERHAWAWQKNSVTILESTIASSLLYEVTVQTVGITAKMHVKSQDGKHNYEFPIPIAEACAILTTAEHARVMDRTRYTVTLEEFTGHVSTYHGSNAGLVLATFPEKTFLKRELPAWCLKDVTHDPRFEHVALLQKPWPTFCSDFAAVLA